MAEKTSKGEGGSWLYGIILMIAGGLIALIGVLQLCGINIFASLGIPDILGVLGYAEILIGAWGFIGGIGLIKDQEWGWGISLVVLSYVIVKFITDVIVGIQAALSSGIWTNWTLWIEIATVAIAAVGIVYLLLTKYKYA